MLPAELPEWARTRIETYFGFQGLAYPSNLYCVYQFWSMANTIFAVVKKYASGDIYCLRLTEQEFEVSNIIYG